jgi:ATP-binding cassette subfamily C (CFTR/MRP) protein 1
VDKLEGNFFLRCPPEQKNFLHSDNKYTSHPLSSSDDVKDADLENSSEDSSHGQRRKQQPVHDPSLMKALHQTFFLRWWSAGALKLGSGAPMCDG